MRRWQDLWCLQPLLVRVLCGHDVCGASVADWRTQRCRDGTLGGALQGKWRLRRHYHARICSAHGTRHVHMARTATQAQCANGNQDGDETDTDCGGSCAKCGEGKHCGSDTDCASDLFCVGAPANATCKARESLGMAKEGGSPSCEGSCTEAAAHYRSGTRAPALLHRWGAPMASLTAMRRQSTAVAAAAPPARPAALARSMAIARVASAVSQGHASRCVGGGG